ncbi:hypothetical protein R3P38DRAFT_3292184 [Favolaschia claudopus]|uniref:Uncharacterized protein n=1 Tax=Favolaschia claudopus TaxID=2862362 RepID=A0AAV9ZKU8_9AGAR
MTQTMLCSRLQIWQVRLIPSPSPTPSSPHQYGCQTFAVDTHGAAFAPARRLPSAEHCLRGSSARIVCADRLRGSSACVVHAHHARVVGTSSLLGLLFFIASPSSPCFNCLPSYCVQLLNNLLNLHFLPLSKRWTAAARITTTTTANLALARLPGQGRTSLAKPTDPRPLPIIRAAVAIAIFAPSAASLRMKLRPLLRSSPIPLLWRLITGAFCLLSRLNFFSRSSSSRHTSVATGSTF